MREVLARYTQCWEKDEVDPSVAVAGIKESLAPRSEVIALDRREAAWSSLENYFALNARALNASFSILVEDLKAARHVSSRRS